MSLQYGTVEDSKDNAWLGTCSFPREYGLNAEALDGWRRARYMRDPPESDDYYYTEGTSPHWNIISDVRGREEYTRREFVRRHPGIRFYASIPLRGSKGSVVGSVTIVDDAPRFGLSSSQMDFLEDVADTISQHLDATMVRSQRQRSERLIQSLALFNSGKSSLRHWWLKQEDARKAASGRHNAKEFTTRERDAAANEEFGLRNSASDKDTATSTDDQDLGSDSNRTNSTASVQDSTVEAAGRLSPLVTKSMKERRKRGRYRKLHFQSDASLDEAPQAQRPTHRRVKSKLDSPANESFDLAAASQHVYARASNLMREALNADGVVFLNVNAALPKGRTSAHNRSSASDRSTRPVTSETDASDCPPLDADACITQAFSTTESSSIRSNGPQSPASAINLSEEALSLLIQRYPHGRIFNFAQDGTCHSASGEESMTSGSNSDSRAKVRRTPRDARRLAQVLPGARTIAFYPVRDVSQRRSESFAFVLLTFRQEARGQLCSCIFVWSNSPLRYFDEVEDVTYLVSWSHSIVAELSRLETIAADKAKGSFISSVSHELRSPLHGVLAAVEFLQDSELTSFQQEMAYTISIAGRTLLDTYVPPNSSLSASNCRRMNHILDYSKISSFTRAQRKQRSAADALQYSNEGKKNVDSGEIGVTSDVDLARLTEE